MAKLPTFTAAGSPVGVTASWTAEGVLSVALRGASASTPEDACVAAVFAGLRIDPAPATDGSLVHAVVATE